MSQNALSSSWNSSSFYAPTNINKVVLRVRRGTIGNSITPSTADSQESQETPFTTVQANRPSTVTDFQFRLTNEFFHVKKSDPNSKIPTRVTVRPSILSYIQVDSKDQEPIQYFLINVAEAIFLCKLKISTITDETEKQKFSEPLIKFRVPPACHSINRFTAQYPNKFEILLGFSTGDILIVRESSTTNTSQFNKDECLSKGSVTSIKWLDQNLAAVSFTSGTIIIVDKNRADPTSVDILPVPTTSFNVVHQKNPKINPVSKWQICKKAINDFSYTTDLSYLATACQDGYVRVLDYKNEKIAAEFKSYFGGFICCSWSPDDHYVIAGGESELIEIFSFPDRKIIARCVGGHSSWVASIVFDRWGSFADSYSFASIGQDGYLSLWNFQPDHLTKPKGSKQAASHVDRGVWNGVATKLNTELPLIEPSVKYHAHSEPASGLVMTKQAIITSDWAGVSRIWAREDIN